MKRCEFDLVAESGRLELDEGEWRRTCSLLAELQPASYVRQVGDPPTRIRVSSYGDPDVAPAILADLERMAGTTLRIEVLPDRWARRRRTRWTVAIAATITVLAGAAYSTWRLIDSRPTDMTCAEFMALSDDERTAFVAAEQDDLWAADARYYVSSCNGPGDGPQEIRFMQG